jgi:hypothetical protein
MTGVNEDTFRLHGRMFISQDGNGYADCDRCAFGDLPCMTGEIIQVRPPCNKAERTDGKDVFWIGMKQPCVF